MFTAPQRQMALMISRPRCLRRSPAGLFATVGLACAVLLSVGQVGCDRKDESANTTNANPGPGTASKDVAGGDLSTPQSPSHVRMQRALKAILGNVAGDYYFGTNDLETALANVRTASRSGDVQNAMIWHSEAARNYTFLGKPDKAIEQIKLSRDCARSIERQRPGVLPKELFATIDYLHALAAFRKAENENCIHCTDGQGCLFPIGEAGIHEKKQGAQESIKYLTKVLSRTPGNSSAIWLLNVANMTLGTFPDGVPPKYRLDLKRLETQVEFPRFENIANTLGIDTLSLSGGAIAEDYDGDGDLDFIVSDWHPEGELRLFKGNGDGTFEPATDSANLQGIFGGLNLVHADYDNDGDMDVYVLRGAWRVDGTGRQPNSLLQNNGAGRFTDVTFDVGLGDQNYPTQNAAFADFDADGDLDLHVGNEDAPNQLFVNDGKGHFVDVAASAGVDDANYTKAASWGDVNDDQLPDLYVSNLNGDNRLYMNQGDGTFVDEAEQRGVSKPFYGFANWFWDVDNDGDLDLFVASYQHGVQYMLADYVKDAASLGLNERGEPDALYLNDGKGHFTDAAANWGLTATTQVMGCNFGDLDNDGYLDFYLGTGYPDFEAVMPNLMYRNDGGRGFQDVTIAGGFGHLQKGHGIAFADFDEDGDQDILAELGGAYLGDRFNNAYFKNPGFENNWIKVRLRGEESNRCGIGSRVKLTIADGDTTRAIYRHVSQGSSFGGNPLLLEIGIGPATKVLRLEVLWPTTGHRQAFENIGVNQTIEILEFEPEPILSDPSGSEKLQKSD